MRIINKTKDTADGVLFRSYPITQYSIIVQIYINVIFQSVNKLNLISVPKYICLTETSFSII